MVSNTADTSAYRYIIQSLRTAITDMARKIMGGFRDFNFPDYEIDDLLLICQDVIEDGWVPAFGVIDGCDAERRAMEEEFDQPGSPFPVRACQFHVIQAVRSKARAVFSFPGAERDEAVSAFLDAFRETQRCGTAANWPSTYDRLLDVTRELARGQEAKVTSMKAYLDREWFSDRWRPKVVDYGLPDGCSRTGPLSTNNFAEAAFRNFKRCFLHHRANKR